MDFNVLKNIKQTDIKAVRWNHFALEPLLREQDADYNELFPFLEEANGLLFDKGKQ